MANSMFPSATLTLNFKIMLDIYAKKTQHQKFMGISVEV